VTPPGPFLQLIIQTPQVENNEQSVIAAQVDTAADLSIIPWETISQLRIPQLDEYPVIGFGGEIREYPRFLVQVMILGMTATTIVPVIAAEDEPYALVGRDVLNQFRLVLDGPNQILEIE